MITTAIFPGRYVQGEGALEQLPAEAARLGKKALAIIDPSVEAFIRPGLSPNDGITFFEELFKGECSQPEIDRLSTIGKSAGIDIVIGLGGGKALDTAKATAFSLSVPVVIVPTLASTDAPTSALAVIYTPEGAFDHYLFLPHNPDCVLVDTAVISNAPARFLVSGMGDALSTWFEAEDCQIKHAGNMTTRPGPMSAYGLARLCYDTLLDYGTLAKEACESKSVTPALEKVVEANTLLSGLGFESGGLSAAHAIHNGLTKLEATHKYWHGEKVAIGTQALLMLTGRPPEVIDEVYDFCIKVGLPVTLAQVGLEDVTDEELEEAGKAACAEGETIFNCSVEVTPHAVVAALKTADMEGRRRLATQH